MLKPRMIEEKMLLLLRKGKISKWFSGIGQEAISIGASLAMEKSEYILPLHRNLGVFTAREVPLTKLFLQFQGKKEGFTKGRDRSFHFGTHEYSIWGMISHLGPQLSIGGGLALAHKLLNQKKGVLAFTGEGGTREGEFHEALNTAAVWKLPVIFLIENNGYGLSTPVSEQYACEKLSDRAPGYGMKGMTIDGNNILEVYKTINEVAESIRSNPEPVLIECMTFRMRGHEEASGTKYVPQELFDEWEKKDPLLNYENFLLKKKLIDKNYIAQVREEISKEIDQSLKEAANTPAVEFDEKDELKDLYARASEKSNDEFLRAPESDKKSSKRLVDSISDGLRQSMERDEKVLVMGQDVAEYGGVFKITEGFLEKFGADRVRNTPLCESAIIGAALGTTAYGFKPVVEMQFADFVSVGFNQIVNNLAKIH